MGYRRWPSLGDKVKITVLASGFKITIMENDKGKGPIIIDTNTEAEPTQKEKEEKEEEKQIADFYGKDKLKEQERETARLKYAVLKPTQFDDHEVIALLERTPTYNRPQQVREELRRLSEMPDFSVGDKPAPRQHPQHDEEHRGGNQITFGSF